MAVYRSSAGPRRTRNVRGVGTKRPTDECMQNMPGLMQNIGVDNMHRYAYVGSVAVDTQRKANSHLQEP
jgi:hypothetical protein